MIIDVLFQVIIHTINNEQIVFIDLLNMKFPDLSPNNKELQWQRFSELLWYSQELGMWLDISRMKITSADLKDLDQPFKKAFKAIHELESGFIANKDESRMVGHYWLRTPELAPSDDLKNSIHSQISKIEEFGNSVLDGTIKTDLGDQFTDVLWIGIGGSSLGPILLVNSLQKKNNGLNFHFLDNIDPVGIKKKFENLGNNLRTTLFVVVSKSGGTPEPKLCMDQARYITESQGFNWSSRAVAITMENSALDQKAIDENWLRRFELPDWVGGRTSITSAVGLLPISLIKSDINNFLMGASIMDKHTRIDDISLNPAALLASSWYIAGSAKGLKDMVVLPYCDSLEVISKYLQQLVMESLGKSQDRQGNLVNQGLAVYGNKGSTDQHAYVQQLRDGIDNFFVSFIEVLSNNNVLPALEDKNPSDFLSGFLQGTRLALSENDRENITITLKTFSEFQLGGLIALFERTVGLYAELVNINAYDQPGVEAGKKAAAEILEIQNNIERLLSSGKKFSLEELFNSIDNPNKDSLFMIVRNMTISNPSYDVTGDWMQPNTLEIRKT